MDRRSFIAGLAAAAVAAPSLVREAFGKHTTVIHVSGTSYTIQIPDVPTIYADGKHDDTAGVQAFLDGKPFFRSEFIRDAILVRRDDGRIFMDNMVLRFDGAILLSAPTVICGCSLHIGDQLFLPTVHPVSMVACAIEHPVNTAPWYDPVGLGSVYRENCYWSRPAAIA